MYHKRRQESTIMIFTKELEYNNETNKVAEDNTFPDNWLFSFHRM